MDGVAGAMTGLGTEVDTAVAQLDAGGAMQGSMKTHRRRIQRVGLAVVAIGACCPLPAHANTLLSGYGGPGQGSQAILGSTLFRGSGGGGSGSGAASGGEGSGAASASLAVSGQGAGASSAPLGALEAGRSSRSPAAPTKTVSPEARLAQAGVAAAHRYQELEHGAAAPSGDPLGLAGADFAYVGVALVALLLSAALMRQITRRPLKGHG